MTFSLAAALLADEQPSARLRALLLAEAAELRARADRLERLAAMANHRCAACRRYDPFGPAPCVHAEAVLRDPPSLADPEERAP